MYMYILNDMYTCIYMLFYVTPLQMENSGVVHMLKTRKVDGIALHVQLYVHVQ